MVLTKKRLNQLAGAYLLFMLITLICVDKAELSLFYNKIVWAILLLGVCLFGYLRYNRSEDIRWRIIMLVVVSSIALLMYFFYYT